MIHGSCAEITSRFLPPQWLLHYNAPSTWRLGFPKRLKLDRMNETDRLNYVTLSANAFGVHRAPVMQRHNMAYSLLVREPVRCPWHASASESAVVR